VLLGGLGRGLHRERTVETVGEGRHHGEAPRATLEGHSVEGTARK